MAFWDVDLTTRAGAQGATHQGSLGAFVFTGMGVLGIIVFSVTATSAAQGIGAAIGAGLEGLVALIAGLRLRAGKGAYWGMAAAALLALELIVKLIKLNIVGVLLGGAVLVVIVNGVRGALALRNGKRFAEDEAELFR